MSLFTKKGQDDFLDGFDRIEASIDAILLNRWYKDDTLEPRYLTWKTPDGVTHVEVEQGISEWVVWDIKDGKMVKTFDLQEKPF